MPYLTVWLQQPAALPALHLAQLIDDSADKIMTTGAFRLWGNQTAQCAELVTWLAADEPLCCLDAFRDRIEPTFPFVRSQLNGIRAATKSR